MQNANANRLSVKPFIATALLLLIDDINYSLVMNQYPVC